MTDDGDLLTRIERVAARARRTDADWQLLLDMENLLAEGYMQALTAEARSRQLSNSIERLVERMEEPGTAVEARKLALQRRTLDQKIDALRSQLQVMREHFIRLGGHEAHC